MSSFADLSKQVNLIDELILAEMICGKKDYYEESIEFSKHLLISKYWFLRISWKNKRRFLLMLVKDVKSIWTLSLFLKSIWNCRPKDAVSSICSKEVWSSYDQVPMDNNRTALPVKLVEDAMINEQNWFSRLEPAQQALVLSELLTVAGGPIIWEILRTAQMIYEKHRDKQLEEIIEYAVVNEPEKAKPVVEQPKKDTPRGKGSFSQGQENRQTLLPGQAQKELETALANWNFTIKAIRDSFKLEELEITFKDDTKRTVWKVNRPKPENIETVDFLQLLPSIIAKRILLYIPQTQYGDLSRVNKYWSFLIDEIKAETQARQKINMDIEKLKDIILRHDHELDMVETLGSSLSTSALTSHTKPTSVTNSPPVQNKRGKPRKTVGTFKPIKKLSDLHKRLDQRGAADENIWKWCSNILKLYKEDLIQKDNEGILPLANLNFPCPLMTYNIKIPLEYPLISDPTLNLTPKDLEKKRYSRWNKDLSFLYPVTKVPSYIFPTNFN
ncbi:uncharacterized protein LOC125049415 isoform X1 [Pieris napi]|uniref:uncharacterized protein LOC125049415 isoform X1 n=2 Tax=Pieris napi TaxID=78633 RepID=UPI001FB867AE|nr:uncharacterized protein LOC125049415 isoform X1 [Pieris napi]